MTRAGSWIAGSWRMVLRHSVTMEVAGIGLLVMISRTIAGLVFRFGRWWRRRWFLIHILVLYNDFRRFTVLILILIDDLLIVIISKVILVLIILKQKGILIEVNNCRVV